MFVEPGAFEPIPQYARVDSDTLAAVHERLLRRTRAPDLGLDGAFRGLERRQPAIANLVAHDLAALEEPAAQGLGYFLAMLVVLAFEEAFGQQLACVELADLQQAVERLIADGEVRASGLPGPFYSEDVLALGQPALLGLLRGEIDAALRGAPSDAAQHSELAAALDAFYETLLVLVLALTQAVAPRR